LLRKIDTLMMAILGDLVVIVVAIRAVREQTDNCPTQQDGILHIFPI
jgi:hypothetical protein